MKKNMFLILFLPSLAIAMEKQSAESREIKNALLNLKQVLVAGRYCYGNHMAIHADAKRRSIEIVKLCQTSAVSASGSEARVLLVQKLSTWQQLMSEVIKIYAEHAKKVEECMFMALEVSNYDLGVWVDLLKSNREFDSTEWKYLEEVFLKKADSAESHKSKAMIAQDAFERNENIDTKLAIGPAVYAWAWYLNLK